jgi:mono/diheme cytochrome c family protein
MMRLLSRPAVSVIALACTILTGCHSQPHLTPQQAQGQHVYNVACAHCHEENDLALKKVPPNLHGVFTRKTLPDGAPANDAEVKRVIMNGKGLMPPFQYQMTQDQLNAVVAYLHTGIR